MHLRVEAPLFRHVSNSTAGFEPDQLTPPPHFPCIREKDAEDNSHGRRLACSVAADEAEHLTWLNVKAQIAYSDQVAMSLRDASELEPPAAHTRRITALVTTLRSRRRPNVINQIRWDR